MEVEGVVESSSGSGRRLRPAETSAVLHNLAANIVCETCFEPHNGLNGIQMVLGFPIGGETLDSSCLRACRASLRRLLQRLPTPTEQCVQDCTNFAGSIMRPALRGRRDPAPFKVVGKP